MVGKKALKDVKRESEQLLACTKQLLELQQNAAHQKKEQGKETPANQTIEVSDNSQQWCLDVLSNIFQTY